MEQLTALDERLFRLLNSLHTPTLDVAMYWITDRWFWVPFYAVLIYLMFRYHGRQGLIVLIGVIVAASLADRISSGFFKPFFARPRPCHADNLEATVHLLNDRCGGAYGFVSSHAANTFALATYLQLWWRRFRWAWLLFVWAAVVSYSRIYVGVHYPADVVGGALLGALPAWGSYRAARACARWWA
ncbi:MAG: phosphatase PAP2 family protein, partial [Catalinimonas sp.]